MLDIKALIFDCDGVLAETEKDGHRVAFNKAFEKEGLDIHWSVSEYEKLVRVSGGKERMKSYFDEKGIKYDDEYIQKLHILKTQIFMDMVLSGQMPIRKGVKRLIEEARKENIKLFICSTSNEKSVKAIADSIFEDNFIWYEKIYAGDIVKDKKPAPDIYNLVKENYNFKGDECVVVEDTRNGLLAAKAAGMNCIITTSYYSKEEDFKEADLLVSSLGDNNDKDYVNISKIRLLVNKITNN